MALADVKKYFKIMQDQRDEIVADMKDFEQALQDGFITKEQLEEIEADTLRVDLNYNRAAYIMWLLNIPRRKDKREKFFKQEQKLIEQFSFLNADEDSVAAENADALKDFRDRAKQLKKEIEEQKKSR